MMLNWLRDFINTLAIDFNLILVVICNVLVFIGFLALNVTILLQNYYSATHIVY
jgi:hypothetical protein